MRIDFISESLVELNQVIENDPENGKRLYAILEHLSKDDELASNLQIDGFRNDDFDVAYLRSLIQHEKYAYRLKVFEEVNKQGHQGFPIKYRAIYHVDHRRKAATILAIMPREVNYEQDEEFLIELIRRYDELCKD